MPARFSSLAGIIFISILLNFYNIYKKMTITFDYLAPVVYTFYICRNYCLPVVFKKVGKT